MPTILRPFRPWVSSWPLREATHPRPSKPPEFSLPARSLPCHQLFLISEFGWEPTATRWNPAVFLHQDANEKSSNLQGNWKLALGIALFGQTNLFATSALSSYVTIFHGPNLITDLPRSWTLPIPQHWVPNPGFTLYQENEGKIQHPAVLQIQKNMKQHAKVLQTFSNFVASSINFSLWETTAKPPRNARIARFNNSTVSVSGRKLRCERFSWHQCTLQRFFLTRKLTAGTWKSPRLKGDSYSKPSFLGPFARKNNFQHCQLPKCSVPR